MKNKSIWIDGIRHRQLQNLKKDINVDILIIGGGISGLSTAYHLKDSKYKIALIDKDKCALGSTSKNTGKLTYMQGLIYNKIENNYDKETAKLYFESQKEAIDIVTNIINKNDINCHLTRTKAYVFSNDESDKINFEKEIEFYNENNIKYIVKDNLPLEYPAKIVFETDDSYVFNPYEYLLGLKNILKDKIDIYENTRCISVDKDNDNYICKTIDNHTITTKYVVVATHYPIFIVPFFTPFKTEIEKFFIGASKIKENKNIQAISYNKPSISIRYYNNDKNNYLLYGRRSHPSSKNLDIRDDYKELNEEYKKYFNKDIEYFYHTHDLMTYDNIPLIGEVSPNLYIMTGYNKWGNTNGSIGGKVISDLIQEKENKYINLFYPKRGLSKDKLKNILLFNINTSSRYIINKINPYMSYYDNNVEIKTINGKRCGIYTDDKGIEHIVSNVCPHMKCNLIFNYIDKTWDCPCHGSRFDIDGNVIDGPSVYDIKIDNIDKNN